MIVIGIGKLIRWLRGERDIATLPDALWQSTVAGLPFIAALSDEEQGRLRALSEAFLAEKEFTAAGGLALTDEMSVSIAAQGCLPILNLGLDYYHGWVGIVVYPDEFIIPRSIQDEFGVVHEYEDVASGEAWNGGPLLISWRDAQMAGSGYNVVIHEFAHKLDMLNGEADGTPPLPASISRHDWETTLLAAYDDFCERVDAAEIGGGKALLGPALEPALESALNPALDPYAAESPGEFFAVMSEAFFETPGVLQASYPALYTQFTVFYRQNPLRNL